MADRRGLLGSPRLYFVAWNKRVTQDLEKGKKFAKISEKVLTKGFFGAILAKHLRKRGAAPEKRKIRTSKEMKKVLDKADIL